mmetsp:Transcript_23177/g.59382  ORF Transcript_23177/g.59382 Transcript_23177/m.59382 type:complete len:224 (+) Transcript_23177:301-972(+)
MRRCISRSSFSICSAARFGLSFLVIAPLSRICGDCCTSARMVATCCSTLSSPDTKRTNGSASASFTVTRSGDPGSGTSGRTPVRQGNIFLGSPTTSARFTFSMMPLASPTVALRTAVNTLPSVVQWISCEPSGLSLATPMPSRTTRWRMGAMRLIASATMVSSTGAQRCSFTSLRCSVASSVGVMMAPMRARSTRMRTAACVSFSRPLPLLNSAARGTSFSRA